MTREQVKSYAMEHKKAKGFYIAIDGRVQFIKLKPFYTGFGNEGWNGYPDIYYSSIDNISVEKMTSMHIDKRNLGCDPEFFFVKDNKLVPSTDVILADTPEVIKDGFQGELNPRPNTCRESSGYRIANAICLAQRMAEKVGASVTFKQSFTVDDETWEKSPNEIKQFGCNPTKNIYEEDFERPDGQSVRFRSAGGHLHLELDRKQKKQVKNIIKVLDIVLGNTCVLIDRDPDNATRRKYYGRAGEHRLKPYGLEYRVPSNFWLRNYVLWSMVTGVARNAIGIVESGLYKELYKVIDIDDVRKAINDNDYTLALKNFEIYKQFLIDNNVVDVAGIDVENVSSFYRWATSKNPLNIFRHKDDDAIIRHWRYRSERYMKGFEKFIKRFDKD